MLIAGAVCVIASRMWARTGSWRCSKGRGAGSGGSADRARGVAGGGRTGSRARVHGEGRHEPLSAFRWGAGFEWVKSIYGDGQ